MHGDVDVSACFKAPVECCTLGPSVIAFWCFFFTFLWDGCPLPWTFQKGFSKHKQTWVSLINPLHKSGTWLIYQWAHPHRVLFLFFIKSMRDQQHKGQKILLKKTTSACQKQKSSSFFFRLVLGLHLMIITLCTSLVKVCAHQRILSSYFWLVSDQAATF